MWIGSEQDPLCTSPDEEFGTLANNAPLTGFLRGWKAHPRLIYGI